MAKRVRPGVKFHVEQFCKQNDVEPLYLFAVLFDVLSNRMTNVQRGMAFGDEPVPEGDEHLRELLAEVDGEARHYAELYEREPKWPASAVELLEMMVANKHAIEQANDTVARQQGPEHAEWTEQMQKAQKTLLRWLRNIQNEGEHSGIAMRLHLEEKAREALAAIVRDVKAKDPAATHFATVPGSESQMFGQFPNDEAAVRTLGNQPVGEARKMRVYRITGDDSATLIFTTP